MTGDAGGRMIGAGTRTIGAPRLRSHAIAPLPAPPGRLALLFATALLAAFAMPAAAQVPDSVPLDTLRVDVVRTPAPLRLVPAAVSTIGAADIATARIGVGLDEALGAVPGVHIANRENLALGSRITMRGFGARAAFGVRGVRIIVDDIPLTLADGQSSLNNLDLVRAGRIEVLRGPASALYGNAAGGVIRIETAAPPPRPELSARITLGDEARSAPGALFRVDAQAAGPIGSGDGGGIRDGRGSGYRIGVSHLTRDGVRDHAAAEQNTLNAQLVHPLGEDMELRVVVNAADAPRALNPGSLPADSARLHPEMAWPNNVRTGSGESARQIQAGITIERRAARNTPTRNDATRNKGSSQPDTHGVDAQLTAWAAHRALENPIPVAFIEIDRVAAGARARLMTQRGAFKFAGGIDLELQRDARYEWSNDLGERGAEQRRDQRDRVTAVAPYLLVTTQLDRLHLSVGARWDRIAFATDDHLLDDADGDGSGERVLSALSPSAALLVELTPRISAFANLGSAFQTPTTTELANMPPATGESCCPTGFNHTLQPERTWGGELGVRGVVTDWLSADAAAFYYDVDDAIVPFQVEGIEERSFFRNAGSTRHRGFELGATLTPLPDLRMRTALTALDVRFQDDGNDATDYEDNRVPGIAPLRLFADVRWSGPVTVELDIEHTGGYYADDANTAAAFADDATVLGARVHAAVGVGAVRLEPFLAVRNITDEVYVGAVSINAFGGRFFEPAAGRMLLIGTGISPGP